MDTRGQKEPQALTIEGEIKELGREYEKKTD
jgi:hypothetical protein